MELLLPLLDPLAHIESQTFSIVDALANIRRLLKRSEANATLLDDLQETMRLMYIHVSIAYRAFVALSLFFASISVAIDVDDDLSGRITTIQSHYSTFLVEMETLDDVADLSASLIALEQSIRQHLAYPAVINFAVCKLIDPLLEKRGSKPWSARSAALHQAPPLAATAHGQVHENARSTKLLKTVAPGFGQRFKPEVLSRIRHSPDRRAVHTLVTELSYDVWAYRDAIVKTEQRAHAISTLRLDLFF